MKKINRKQFLTNLGVIGTAAAVSPSVLASSSPSMKIGKPLDRKIKVGIIGCGSVSNRYFPHLSNSPYAEIVSACDIKPERAQKRAEEFNVGNWYPHIDKMLEGVPFDLMVNLTDMQEHGRLNRQALMAGKHVWSEKPMANTYAEAKELLDLSRITGCQYLGRPGGG